MTASSHLGIVCCKACAAFFRRAIVLERNYICRQTTGNCNIARGRFICKRGRYLKCLSVGMTPESVTNTHNFRMSDVDAGLVRKSTKIVLQPFDNDISKTPLLDVISEQYRVLEQIVSKSDDYVMRETFGDLLPMRDSFNGYLQVTIGLMNKCVAASLQPIIDVVNSCFPEISESSDNEKWLLHKHFMTSQFIFDGVNLAQQSFPGNDKIFMMTFPTFLDLDQLEFYASNLEGACDRQHSMRIWNETISKCIGEWIGPLLTRAKVDEVEVAAIHGLLYCPSHLARSSTRVLEVCYKYQLRIFQDLHNHFEKTGAENSSRVAHVNSILMAVQAVMQRMREDMQIYRLLDVYNGNEWVYNIVK